MKSRTAAEVSQLIKPSSQRFPPSVSSGNLNSIFQCVARGLCIDMWYSGKTEWGESIKILTQYWETSPKSSGAAFSPPFLSLPLPSLSVLPPSFTLSSVSSISRPLLYLPLASHCRALREAQTALDKVRMIHVLWFFWIWAMVKKKEKKTFGTMLFFESACNIWLNTGVSTRANMWMKARVGLHQAGETERNCFMCLVNILNVSGQIISLCSPERGWAQKMCQCWQFTNEVCSRALLRRSVSWDRDSSTVTSVGLHRAAEVWYHVTDIWPPTLYSMVSFIWFESQ